MARKLRLAKFDYSKKGRIEGHTLENGTFIVTYIDWNCPVTPVGGLQYLVDITLEKTCESGPHIGKPIFFANIICPSEEATITLLLDLAVKYEFINGKDLVFSLAGQECDSQKLKFRICEHKFEVYDVLPEIFQRFVAHEEELANLHSTLEDSKCESQILVYPTSYYVLQGRVAIYTSTEELNPNYLYLAKTPNPSDAVTPIFYRIDSPVQRGCYIDYEVIRSIKESILREYSGFERIGNFKLFTKLGNSIFSSNIAYSFNITDGWKGVWVNEKLEAAPKNRGNNYSNVIQNNCLLIYKPEPDSNIATYARIYIVADLLEIFCVPKKTRKIIEKLTKNDNNVL
jgi:hypothetical protein